MNPVPRVPPGYSGPALFSYGFRPFFLGGAIWAALTVTLRLPQFYGELSVPTAFAPLDWHSHELLFGYATAVIAGFLLTAIPNWTGRLPVAGAPLAALFMLWLAGRIAIFFSSVLGLTLAAIVDVAFLVMLAGMALREIIAGRNWRNLRVLSVLAVLIAGNVIFHLEAAYRGAADYGIRTGIAAAIGLIILIGGRVVPSFTHNWLARQAPGALPQPFSRFDALVIALSALALALWIALPTAMPTAGLLVTAGVLHLVRLGRWAGYRTWSDRLVLILHVGYCFVPIGFLTTGAVAVWPQALPMSAGIHAWTAGAVGIMTLAVMTRATLGHTGRPLVASYGTQVIYGLAVIAVLGRIAAVIMPGDFFLHTAAFAWIGAFGGFVMIFGPMLVKPRLA